MLVAGFPALAQPAPLPTSDGPLAPPPNGPRRTEPLQGWVALTNVTVHVKPGTTIAAATLVIRDGRVQAVLPQAGDSAAPGPDGQPAGEAPKADMPPPSQVIDGRGLHVYAGFIEPFIEVAVPRADTSSPGAHWNPRITPQRDVLDRGSAGIDDKLGQSLRSLGFTAAGLAPKGGLIRGQGAVVALSPKSPDPSDRAPTIYARSAFQAAGFEDGDEFSSARGGAGDDARWTRYPDSQMGAIALIRQTFSDADWLAENPAGPGDQPVDALTPLLPAASGPATPILWDVADELEAFRALTIGREFKRPSIILGSGREYRRLEALAAFNAPVIIPLNYPKRPRVGTIGEAESVGLGELIAWEQAPTNPRRLDAAGLTVALTSSKIPDKLGGRGAFRERLASALRHGLPPARALAMLTTNPAQILGVDKTLGTIEPGKAANLVIADGPLFTDRPDAPRRGEPGYIKPGTIIEVWIDGRKYPVKNESRLDVAGTWAVDVPEGAPAVTIEIDADDVVTVIEQSREGDKTARTTARARDWSLAADGRFSFVFDRLTGPAGADQARASVVSGVIERDGAALVMHAQQADDTGAVRRWTARFKPEGAKAAGDRFRPTPRALAGDWLIAKGDQKPEAGGKPDGAKRDPAAPVITLTRERTVSVKRSQQDRTVTAVTYDLADDPAGGSQRVVTKIRFTADGLSAADAPAAQVVLTPTPDADVLEATINDQPARLVRRRDTPEADDLGEIPDRLGLPVGPYALAELPEQPSVLISNATVWTSGPAGVIDKGFVAIQNGKITHVGDAAPSLQGEWITIDADGKHLTPGIIDCHSHTGISRGVNESAQAVTAEVRIGDVTDPDSISWYRQLAGGVTAVNSLHGSANPIGGQNQVNKVRWGCVAPSDMHFEGAIPGIKFALGENVKQSNWGDRNTSRYPQTRMGVEGILRDRFLAARQYAALRKEGKVRRDLELDALAEILAGERLVHCHSYRQDEILMLARLSREFGFRLGTYQHILEGYKVADAVRDSAIGASAFSDWWAFKMEVQDAIPYAGAIMHEVGVVVSFNSDSDELARRMNVEAGKALKYGGPGMTPADAFKFVTLNPAKQLKVDDRVGSLEVGKDADLVLWSGMPMSPTSRAERTWVDGRELFSLERDRELRKSARDERQRILQKILRAERREKGAGNPTRTVSDDAPAAAPAPGQSTSPDSAQPGSTPPELWADAADLASGRAGRRLLLLDSLRQAQAARRELFLSFLKRGVDVRFARTGDCGCDDLSQAEAAR